MSEQEKLSGTPRLSDAKIRSSGGDGVTAILDSFRVKFGNTLAVTPRDADISTGAWEEEWYPDGEVCSLHKSVQWIDLGESCPTPRFEWDQQREHTYSIRVSPKAVRLGQHHDRHHGHLGIDSRATRTCIHYREVIGKSVSEWSNGLWFDVDETGRLLDHGYCEIAGETQRHEGERGNLERLEEKCQALGFDDDEARTLAELIAQNNNASFEDPVGVRAWEWLTETVSRTKIWADNISQTIQVLSKVKEAAQAFWGWFT